ncbi:hypothetical protein C7974DRAFT_389729 [Boeremia exigua]|uniref:uncharacterized protein n=1 Tax=Boeremia exigua TaxID=749465 RepID=UPI001E8D375C|nr:uncharacterized protein C7974DRAFT_389729 [Boeremia exigua]KAH6637551.1 hypothetical protein C7974DRAFT_389729 [Boeremia exigua]
MIRARSSLGRLSTQLKSTGNRWYAAKTSGKKTGKLGSWTPEALRTTERYPLSLELFARAHPTEENTIQKNLVKTSQKKGLNEKPLKKKQVPKSVFYARPQIVSPDLCDDVLSYYGKHLEVHRGCDILDINPGAGLWSQKLHALLQPRRHVLMEPNDRFASFLAPLLEAPDSRYTLVLKDTNELSSYKEMLDEGVFPEQTRVDPHDNSGQELNTTLLITGMLVWEPLLPGLGFDSMAKQLYNLFSAAVRSNDQFHAYGRVRTLFWVGADDFRPIIAESMANFNKNNCLLELTQNMEFIVNCPRGPRVSGKGGTGRDPHQEVESAVRAMQRARECGMTLPAHRADKIHTLAAEVEELTEGTGKTSYTWLHDYLLDKHRQGNTVDGLLSIAAIDHHANFLELQAKYPDIDLETMGNAKDAAVKRQQTFWEGRENHPGRADARAFSMRKTAYRGRLSKKEMVETIADVGEKLYYTEGAALRAPDGTAEKTKLLEEVAALDAQWDKQMNSLQVNYRAVPLSAVDDRISLRAPPRPRIQWDRRSFEPLTMSADEVWPPVHLALISSTPHARPPGQTVDFYEWVHDFVYALFPVSSVPLPEALEKMQHGLSEIMDSCPSLRDPEKGGRMLMKHLRVRLLTGEMIEELVGAYRDWPFKEPGSDHNKYFRWKGQNKAAEFAGG